MTETRKFSKVLRGTMGKGSVLVLTVPERVAVPEMLLHGPGVVSRVKKVSDRSGEAQYLAEEKG